MYCILFFIYFTFYLLIFKLAFIFIFVNLGNILFSFEMDSRSRYVYIYIIIVLSVSYLLYCIVETNLKQAIYLYIIEKIFRGIYSYRIMENVYWHCKRIFLILVQSYCVSEDIGSKKWEGRWALKLQPRERLLLNHPQGFRSILAGAFYHTNLDA